MKSNRTVVLGLLLACLVLAVCPFFLASKHAEFGGADDAAGAMVSILDPNYEPWAEPILEKILGRELPGETESLLFCLQAAVGAGIVCYGFGYLIARKKYRTGDEEK
ncbi:MAG: energy-coupling factor ABC transporter substrate-binding protein [Hungatella sp.]